MNIIEVVTKEILAENNEDIVREMVDEQMSEYVPEGWEEEYDSEYDAYCETCSDEAESDIINSFIRKKEKKYKKFHIDEFCAIYDNLKEKWEL